MAEHKITFFPVGNGDSILITLTDDSNILIDCNFTGDSEDENNNERFDVKSYLLEHIKKDDGIPYIDAFILTHPDQDHCRNFEKHFYLGDPQNYDDNDKQKILIGELWFAPRIFCKHEELCDDASAFKKEVERRINIYKNESEKASEQGNRIRVIGFSDNPELEGLDDIITVPGNEVNLINGSLKDDFKFFVLSPLKGDLDDDENGRNDTSIALQAAFKVKEIEDAGLAIFSGDAGANNWLRIIEKNEELTYDLFLAPHHCSRYFFNEEKESDDKLDSLDEIIEFLSNGRTGCYIISSSKAIKDDDDNPPHYLAAQEYKEHVDNDHFICLSEYPKIEEPKPLIFIITENGPLIDDTYDVSKNEKKELFTVKNITRNPKTYGRQY